MQKGFTRHSSSVNAALVISEVQAEAKELKQPLNLVTLDACKAFDVVWQDSLLRKLFNTGIQGNLWSVLNQLYTGATTAVKWKNHTSEKFTVKQGVRQGGILSTLHYKLYNNNLLLMLEDLHVGATVGHINCCAPTCADDVAILATTPGDLQTLLDVVHNYTTDERYLINPQKSAVVPLASGRNSDRKDRLELTLGGGPIQYSKEEVHLGVERNKAGKINIGKRVELGRRTMYALMGAGAYGSSGVIPSLSAHMCKSLPYQE